MAMARRSPRPGPPHRRGFTLIELLVTVSLGAILLAVGVPGMQRFIVNNRLKSVNSQLVTDLQFARAEAASRNMPVYWSMKVQSGVQTCYTIFTSTIDGADCNCTLGAGAACTTANQREIKTVQIRWDGTVRLSAPGLTRVGFDHVNGGQYYGTTDFADAVLSDFIVNTSVIGDTSRMLRTAVSPAGRPIVCSSGGTHISGYSVC